MITHTKKLAFNKFNEESRGITTCAIKRLDKDIISNRILLCDPDYAEYMCAESYFQYQPMLLDKFINDMNKSWVSMVDNSLTHYILLYYFTKNNLLLEAKRIPLGTQIYVWVNSERLSMFHYIDGLTKISDHIINKEGV